MEVAVTSPVATSLDCRNGGGSKANALNSSNGLTILASLTLKKALKVENSDNHLEQQLLQNTGMDITTNPNTNQQQHHLHQQKKTQPQQSVSKNLLDKVVSLDSKMINTTETSTKICNTIAISATSSTKSTLLTTKNSSLKTHPKINVKLMYSEESSTSNTTTTASVPPVISIKHNFKIPSDILDDLASRFIINVPDMELSNLIRICFQVELAYWFYLDFFCASDEEKKLQPCGIKQFAMQLFQHIPFLREHLSKIDKVLEDWKNYKLSVPTFGAILISEDLNYCLLVQSYFAKSSWGFPKGKVNENEDPEHCAAREVYEETGYDITDLIVPNDFIEAVINYQYTRLYIVRNVSLNTQFSPRTRNEIKCCDWFPIDSLPINKNDAISKAKLGINANSFFMIMPFVKRLKKWVNDKRNGNDEVIIAAAINTSAINVVSTSSNGGQTRRKHSNSLQQSIVVPKTNSSKIQSTVASISSKSISPLAANMTTISGNLACNSNQKYINVNSNCKKNKQQKYNTNNVDDNNISNGSVFSTGNVNNLSANNNNNNNTSSNRSKRERHKSMGDLDGVKLNNLNQQQTALGKNINNDAATTSNSIISSLVNCNNSNNNKRNLGKILIPGNSSGNINTIKRQLFHSQNHHMIVQQNQGEKIVSSFDLIRKEKQQQIKAAKAQKQQLQKVQHQLKLQSGKQDCDHSRNISGRVRAKSQGDKVCIQHQQTLQQVLNKNNSNNKQLRTQKSQETFIVNNAIQTMNDNTSPLITSIVAPLSYATKSQTLPSNTGLKNAAAVTASNTAALNLEEKQLQQQMKPRAASVALHCGITRPAVTTLGVQRMASGTELRILKRSNSQQQQLNQYEPIKFTPSFSSWTNFSFTKNFITNVFC